MAANRSIRPDGCGRRAQFRSRILGAVALAVAAVLAPTAHGAVPVTRYAAPVNVNLSKKLAILRRDKAIRIKETVDATEISYPVRSQFHRVVTSVTESATEDANFFTIDGPAGRVLDLGEEDPVWGYVAGEELSFFFVDDPQVSPLDIPRYQDFPYGFDYVSVTSRGLSSFHCPFDISALDGPEARKWRDHRFDTSRDSNPYPSLILRHLLRGRAVDVRHCEQMEAYRRQMQRE